MKKITICVVLLLAICANLVVPSNACVKLPYHLLTPSLTNLTSTIYEGDTSIQNELGYNIGNYASSGATSWNYTGDVYPDVYFSAVPYSSGSHTVYFLIGDYGAGWQGGCMVYNSNGVRVNPATADDLYPGPTSNWSYAIIRIHADDWEIANGTGSMIKAVAAHEVGHALGIDHCLTLSHQAIMYIDALFVHDYYGISAPTSADRNMLWEIY